MAENRILPDSPGCLTAYNHILMARLLLNQGGPKELALRHLDKVNETYLLPDWLHMRRGVCYRDAGQPKRALQSLTWAERLAGPSVTLLEHQAHCWFDLREWKQALRTVEHAIDLSRDPELYELRADILVELGRYDEALQVYDRATEGIDRVCARAYVHERMGDFNMGIHEIDEGLRSYPDAAELVACRGHLKVCQGDLDGARWDYSLALVLDDNPVLLARRAILDVELGRLEEATRDAELAYSKFPEGELSLKAMAIVSEANQAFDESILYWERYNSVTVDDQARLFHAELLNRLGRFEESDRIIEAYVEEFPNCWEGLYYRAAIARTRGHFELAETCLEQAMLLQTPEENLLFERAVLYYEWERYDRADVVCRELLEKFPDFQEGRELLVDIMAEAKSPELALPLIEELLDEEYDMVNLFRKGYILSKAGRFSEALEILDVAVEEDPENPDYLEVRAKTRTRIGRHHQALQDAEMVLDLDPGRLWVRLLRAYLLLRCGHKDACANEARALLKEDLPYSQRLFCRALLLASRIIAQSQTFLFANRIFDRFR